MRYRLSGSLAPHTYIDNRHTDAWVCLSVPFRVQPIWFNTILRAYCLQRRPQRARHFHVVVNDNFFRFCFESIRISNLFVFAAFRLVSFDFFFLFKFDGCAYCARWRLWRQRRRQLMPRLSITHIKLSCFCGRTIRSLASHLQRFPLLVALALSGERATHTHLFWRHRFCRWFVSRSFSSFFFRFASNFRIRQCVARQVSCLERRQNKNKTKKRHFSRLCVGNNSSETNSCSLLLRWQCDTIFIPFSSFSRHLVSISFCESHHIGYRSVVGSLCEFVSSLVCIQFFTQTHTHPPVHAAISTIFRNFNLFFSTHSFCSQISMLCPEPHTINAPHHRCQMCIEWTIIKYGQF